MDDWAVDDIIEIPESAMLREYGYVPNEAKKRKTAKQRAVEEAGYYVEVPQLDPFLGYENLLVRTALIRSKKFPSSRRWLPNVGTPKRAAHLCYHMAAYDQEYMVNLALDNKTRLVAIHETAIGTRSSTHVDVLDFIKLPLLTGSSSIIVVHNHPSGDPMFSPEDQLMLRLLKEKLDCVGVALLDFITVGENGYYSDIEEDQGSWDEYLIKSMSRSLRR